MILSGTSVVGLRLQEFSGRPPVADLAVIKELQGIRTEIAGVTQCRQGDLLEVVHAGDPLRLNFGPALGLISEVKWSKTDLTVVEQYEHLIEAFFDEVKAGRVIGRIMFTQNARVARGLAAEERRCDGFNKASGNAAFYL
jgi:hypothetical protein